MAGVIKKFFTASMLMWTAPVVILYGFNHNLVPGLTQLSPYSLTLLSGLLAVISVNLVIAFYIYMAMEEPSNKHEPDAKFLAEAKASIQQAKPTEAEDSFTTRTKTRIDMVAFGVMPFSFFPLLKPTEAKDSSTQTDFDI